MNVKIATNDKEIDDAFSVRHEVFVNEQNVPLEEEMDQYDKEATHFVLYDNGQPIGAGRCRQLEDVLKVERICVLSSYRKKGCGILLMQQAEEIATKKGIHKLKLNAQTHAENFYKKLGYETVSEDVFMDAGIPHVTMVKHV
ncbi:GNAT family N-acetyltransferase [Bacillus sp. Marseille-P3661]|uniref:GNAT family N-acetyltransferase n=1 Tax=Bacillus sp. Marseille-P3661 TaxID=1936234 RepID=UPI000C8472C9|nr:GNAT family N-acetyltransferase [Bacillus sp. Marseille-P3661]